MTSSEQAQPRDVFARAGRLAYRMAINRDANPYPKGSKYAASWDYGYMAELGIFGQRIRQNVQAHKPKSPKSPRPYRGNQQLDRDRRTVGSKDVRRGQR
jgi:hypothetical protein